MPGQGQSVSGRTRGEHYRPFNLDALTVPEGGWTFVCPEHESYFLLLKSPKKYVIDGEVIKEKGRAARFREFRFSTRNAEVADLLRASGAFRKGRIKELGDAKAQRAESKAQRLRKLLEEDPELKAAAQEMLAAGKGKTPTTSKKKDAEEQQEAS